MKARFDFQGILQLDSETLEEKTRLSEFMTKGFYNGFYVFSVCYSDQTTGWIAVNNKKITPKKKKEKV